MSRLDEPVSVGVSVIVWHPSEEDKFLVGRRIYKEGAGLQTLPGGKVDAGESPSEAAAREVHEETGLLLADIRPFGIWAYERLMQDYQHYVDLFFHATAVDPDQLTNTEPDKNAGWHWLRFDQVEDETFWDFKERLRPAIGWD